MPELRTLLGEFAPDDVFRYLGETNQRVVIEPHKTEYRLNLSKDRYRLFAKSRTCVWCGLTGTVMRLEYNDSSFRRPSFNLYGFRGNTPILMTRDHIIPRSRGGKDRLSNYQTMCEPCNNLKGDMMPDECRLPARHTAYRAWERPQSAPVTAGAIYQASTKPVDVWMLAPQPHTEHHAATL
jgi:5-methylcytosine-specific restriction endonuclease McrA